MSKPALGRGLGALLGGGKPSAPATHAASAPAPASGAGPAVVPIPLPPTPPPTGARQVALDRVFPSPLQPRKDFTEESLRELADSIREQGIVQPLIVRPVGDRWELIAGERRWRAARLAGLGEVPVLERAATDREVLELALIENLQRENLNPWEEALGYAQLQSQFQLTQEQVAQKVGRSRVAVTNALRLLKLEASLQDALRQGQLSTGHAKVLLGLTEPTLQASAAEQVLQRGLNVRQTEELVAQLLAPRPTPTPSGTSPHAAPGRDPHVVDVENRLRERLATKVALRYRAGRGSLEIRFHSDDELNRILELVGIAFD
jgi:ParB family chromosome partitioning protein